MSCGMQNLESMLCESCKLNNAFILHDGFYFCSEDCIKEYASDSINEKSKYASEVKNNEYKY